ncbi:MAG: helix-turn-helix transcriptional regulator [Clostridia bacterium]
MSILINFIERLCELMQENNLNSKQLAQAVGISQTSISKWMNNKKTVSLKHLLLLANYFNCSLDYLTGRSDDLLSFTPHSPILFSQRIREILQEQGSNRYRFVKQTRFTDTHFYRWDKGAVPQLATLEELANLFDCSIDYLVGRER